MPSTMSSYLVCRPVILGLAKVLLLGLGQMPTVQGFPVHVSYLFNTSKGDDVPKESPSTLMYLAVAAALVLLGGAFAGLTIALMGQDEVYLQVIRDSGEGKEKRNAGKVLRLLKRGKHWVLVTLLLGNVITNETLPIILDRSLGGGWPAVLGSTVLIVIFGEIVPQSVCVRYGLPIGAWMAPFVLVLMYILSPVAWPTAKLLDFLLGQDHGTVYKKSGLKTLVSLHRSIGEAGQRLHPDEVTIITAVLDLKDKSVGSVMTPMEDVFTLSLDDVLDEATMDDILSKGYSRIPVHHPDNDENFIGMLLVKILITYDPEDAKPVRDFALATLPETRPDTSCLDVLNYFQEGKSHMLLVSNHPGEDHGAIGVVTLEDVIEELIGEEIIDESDVFLDVHKAIRRLAPAPRTRIPKTILATDKAPLRSATGDLIDIAEEDSLDAAELQKTGTNEDTLVKAKEIAQRRLSANSGSFDIRIGKRASIDEVKEHLKHLGPSNLASRPKATRYASVKIKPGTDARAPTVDRQTPVRRVSENATEFAAGVGEGIVPDGGKAASDAVQALRQDYGTLSTSPNQKRPTSANKGIQAEVDGHSTGVANSENKDKTHTRPYAQTNSSQHSLSNPSAHRKRSKSPFYRHRGPARSGSITENIIDTNGIRKVVLETTSSSDSNDEEDNSGANKHREDFRRTSSHRSGSNTTPHVTIDKHGDNNHGENGTTVKKKRRRKKRVVKGEHEPLLREED